MTGTMLPGLGCADEDARRHELALEPGVQGIDYLEVRTAPAADNQRVLEVHFVQKATPAGTAALATLLAAFVAHPEAILVRGGTDGHRVRVLSTSVSAGVLEVRVDRPGDASTYTLVLRDPAGGGTSRLDPVFSGVRFSFKAGCPTRFDCRGEDRCDPEEYPEPVIDYLAKDFRSFRQALLDRLPTIAPEWTERHEADLGVALIELLAYAGDQLTYQQDAVANEAFLETARQRISVRRHARLVDYRLDEGASARAYVTAHVSAACTVAAGSQLLTRLEVPFGTIQPPLPAVLSATFDRDADRARASALVFETHADALLDPRLQDIAVHTWDLGDCCLPVGATTIDVAGDLAFDPAVHGPADAWRVRAGRLVVLEEAVGAETGLEADADPGHRQVVRLVAAVAVEDPLATGPVTRLTWAPEDALAFSLCVTRRDDASVLQPVARLQANVLVADHGQSRQQWWPEDPRWLVPQPAGLRQGLRRSQRPTRFVLDEGPISAWRPYDDHTPVAKVDAARATLQVRPRVEWSALPADRRDYGIADDLIGARPFDDRFVAEPMNDGRASIRFGDGVHGRPPLDGSFVNTRYRVGRGREGNVGIGAVAHLLRPAGAPGPVPAIERLGNLVAARGGADPETIAQAKAAAPVAFRSPQLRAVTAEDYAEVAMRHPAVSGAVARFRWTGSWLTIFLTIDPKDRTGLTRKLVDDIKTFVAGFTQAGYDLEVRPPVYVPLDLELFVCVAGDRFREHVERAVREALSARRLPHGRLGFFHPDRFGFGQPLYLSALYAAVAAVPGVDSVTARRFSRYYDDDPLPARALTAAHVDAGVIDVGPLEVLELASDPSQPERGVLSVTTGGGR